MISGGSATVSVGVVAGGGGGQGYNSSPGVGGGLAGGDGNVTGKTGLGGTQTAGGASAGVISSAKNNGAKITWFDDSGFSRAPDTIISSTTNAQDKMAYQKTFEYLEGQTPWGTHKMVGIKEGFVDFVQDDENYIKNVPADIREKMATLIEEINKGKDVRN